MGIKEIKKLIKEELDKKRLSFLLETPEILDEKSILKNKYPFNPIYIFGPAGAGKSYIASNLLNIPKDFVVSNPDERIEEVFPAFGISMKFANAETGGDADLETLQQKSRVILQNASRTHTANLIGIANPRPAPGPDLTKVFIPTTSPFEFINGPAELPGLIAASV